MAAVNQLASQVVFHPIVSQSLKLGATTLGRDKVYRGVQYFARFYAWCLLHSGSDKLAVARWNALKSHLATARKCRLNACQRSADKLSVEARQAN